MYTITVHNRQGASDEHRAETKAAIDRYLETWADPENLTALVTREGSEVGSKPYGRKRIEWSPEITAAALLGRKGGRVEGSKGIGKLTPDQRHERAKQAAAKRWGVRDTSLTVKYEGKIPRTLRAYGDAHAHQIQEITWSAGYDDGGAYDAFLRAGWCKCDDCVHTLINSTAAGLIGELRDIVPCDCPDCLERLAKTK